MLWLDITKSYSRRISLRFRTRKYGSAVQWTGAFTDENSYILKKQSSHNEQQSSEMIASFYKDV